MKKNDDQKKYVRLQYMDDNASGYIYCYVNVDDIYRAITSKRGATQVILKDQKPYMSKTMKSSLMNFLIANNFFNSYI